MHYSNILLFAALAAPCLAAPYNTKRVVHETRNLAAESWSKKSKVEPGRILPVRIGISQSNLEKGHDMLMDVSDPTSSNFGKHLSIEEVRELFAPSQEAVDAITGWLQASGISKERVTQTNSKGWITFDAETEELESLLFTEYHEYEHSRTLHTSIGCEKYHIPEHLQKHVDFITPGVNLISPLSAHSPRKAPKKSPVISDSDLESSEDDSPDAASTAAVNPDDLTSCDKALTPACIATLYSIPPTDGACAGNNLGIYSQGTYSQATLDNFFANVSTKIPLGTRPNLENVDGGSTELSSEGESGETELDLQVAYPIIYPQIITLYEVDPVANNTGFLETFLESVDASYCTSSTPKGIQCGSYKPTNVISVSYGKDEGSSVDVRQCQEFMKLGLQGVTVVFSSGDNGVGGTDDKCLDGGAFNPLSPASCPYVTAVGGTEVALGKTVKDPEVAWPFSGGGFSNTFSSPSYQQAAISSYFANSDPGYKYYSGDDANGGIYNRSGRGIPDVSAGANNIQTAENGTHLSQTGGTSASAPMFASIINRINEERIKAGKGPVGFVNPTLYANPGVLNDITEGSNPGCGTQGFSASKGWDPVTGLGTPNFGKMLDLFMSLP